MPSGYTIDYGTGSNSQIKIVQTTATPGDFNGDGKVDAADYTVWRDTLGSTSDLRANGDNTGTARSTKPTTTSGKRTSATTPDQVLVRLRPSPSRRLFGCSWPES